MITTLYKRIASILLGLVIVLPATVLAIAPAHAVDTQTTQSAVVLADDYDDPAPNDPASNQNGTEQYKGKRAKSTVSISKDNGDVQGVVDSINAASKKDWLEYDPSAGYVTFNNQGFNQLSTKSKNKYMEDAVAAIRQSSLSAQFKNKFYGFLKNQDSSAYDAAMRVQKNSAVDIEQAMNILRGIGAVNIFGIILGILVIFIWISIVLVTICDLLIFIAPVMRWGPLNPIDHNGDFKRGFISYTAYSIIVATEINKTSNQPQLWLYLKNRIAFVVLAIMVTTLLVTGQIHIIMGVLADMISPIIDSLVSGN